MKVVLAKSPLRADGKIIGDAGGKVTDARTRSRRSGAEQRLLTIRVYTEDLRGGGWGDGARPSKSNPESNMRSWDSIAKLSREAVGPGGASQIAANSDPTVPLPGTPELCAQ